MLDDLILGKPTPYPTCYSPDILQPIPRQLNRDKIDVTEPLPFYGCDIWNAYELSWLNPKGKPVVAIGQFTFSCTSPCLVESKSFKLYLNSLNQVSFDSVADVISRMQRDLSDCVQRPVQIQLWTADDAKSIQITQLAGVCIDHLDITTHTYLPDPQLLRVEKGMAEELLYSDLLKSNCPLTNQPDWGTIQIYYKGPQINHESLLTYIISFRHFQEFRECCVERIFMDIQRQCQPQSLTVYVCEARRGGLDINPYRSTQADVKIEHQRLWRQ